MPIQISGLPADILPEVKSMKNKKRIIAAVFTAAAIVTGFMRWNFFIKPKPVTDIRFWQDFEGKINYKIGNEYSAWSDHSDYDVDDIINIVAEIKTGADWINSGIEGKLTFQSLASKFDRALQMAAQA